MSVTFDALEPRRLLTAVITPDGELILQGTIADDEIIVDPGPGSNQVVVFGVDGVEDGTVISDVNALTIRLLEGDDIARVNGPLRISDGTHKTVRIEGGPGNDMLLGARGSPNKTGASRARFFWQGAILNGGDGNDIIEGSIGDDAISGGRGNDTLIGADGYDTMLGGAGDDLFRGGQGKDTLRGGPDDDRLFAGFGHDILVGGNGRDRLFGGQDRDELYGNNGGDLLHGGPGQDELQGGMQNDTLRGAGGNDRLYGNIGNDRLFGGDGNDWLFGNRGKDSLLGGSDNDRLFGNDGRDTLKGNQGNDILRGGAHLDQLFGNRGNDTFRSPFVERQDFNSADNSWTLDARKNRRAANLPPAIWHELEWLDEELGLDVEIWQGADAMQTLRAHSGILSARFTAAIDALGDAESQALFARIDPITSAFRANIGTRMMNLTSGRVFSFFIDLQGKLEGELGDLMDSYLQIWSSRNNRDDLAVDRAMHVFQEFGSTAKLTPAFRALFNDFMLNLVEF